MGRALNPNGHAPLHPGNRMPIPGPQPACPEASLTHYDTKPQPRPTPTLVTKGTYGFRLQYLTGVWTVDRTTLTLACGFGFR